MEAIANGIWQLEINYESSISHGRSAENTANATRSTRREYLEFSDMHRLCVIIFTSRPLAIFKSYARAINVKGMFSVFQSHNKLTKIIDTRK